MSTEKNLIGFNIGPIYEVMKHSKKTRELWFGSYLFSMIIKMVYDKLDKKNYKIIKPSYEEDKIEKITAGLFPDRIVATILKNKKEVDKELKEITDNVKSEFAQIVNNLVEKECIRPITDKNKNIYKATKNLNGLSKQIIEEYLQLDYVILPQNKIEEKDIIKEVESYLDAVELNRSFTLGKNEPTCYRCKSLPAVIEVFEQWEKPANQKQKLCPFCFIKLRSHFSKEIQKLTGIEDEKPFPSLVDISAIELKEKYSKLFKEYEDQDEQILFENSEIRKELKDYHKYYALYMADGDNLSKVAKHLSSPEELSKYLFSFGKCVHNISKNDFKGEPIYIGGDDILAIMPFAFNEKDGFKTILDFAARINDLYNEHVAGKITGANNDKTSLSAGIVIAYYKFPLSIAMEEVQKQLFESAKRIENKNGLAVKFIQHSGAESNFQMRFNDPILSVFSELYKSVLSSEKGFPAVHHKIDKYKTLLINLGSEIQLDNLLEKRFYEGFENEKQKELFTSLVKASLLKFLKGNQAEEELNRIGNMLHILKFIKGEK